MFGKLKDKLKNAVKKFSKETSESDDIKEEEIEVSKEVVEEKSPKKELVVETAEELESDVEKIEEKPKVKPEEKVEEKKEEKVKIQEKEIKEEPVKSPVEEPKIEKESVVETAEELEPDVVKVEEKVEEVKEEKKKGFFSKIKEKVTTSRISEDKFDDLFWELELGLLESDVAVEVIEKIKSDLKKLLTEERVAKGKEQETIMNQLKTSIEELFIEPFDILKEVKKEKPYVIAMIGVNGCGKTTSMAKLAHKFKQNGLKVAIAAADTFRAAAIDQAKHHAEKLDIPIISQGYGADPAAVAFDAIKYGKAKDMDVVIIDTAGRLHSNTNLMNELEKLIRVNNPHLKIFVGEAITGNDAINQSRQFNDLVGIDAIILTKADVDEKGGACISTSYVTGKPILFLGTGQTYDDLQAFNKERLVSQLFE